MRPLKPKYKHINNKSLLLIATCLVLLFSGCELTDKIFNTKSNEPKEEISENEKPYRILLFCDITNSVNKDSIKRVKEKVEKLISSVKDRPGSKITAYPIDSGGYSEALFEFEVPECEFGEFGKSLDNLIKKECANKVDRVLTEKYGKEFEKSFGEILTKKYRENLQVKNLKQRSCIVNTLKKTYKFFYKSVDTKARREEDKYISELIYLSDMIEQCNSSIGAVYLCSESQKPNLDSILKLVESNYAPDFTLGELLGNKVSFVITTEMIGNPQHKCLTAEKLENFWETIFLKNGYSRKQFRLLHWEANLPDRFK